MYNFNEIIDRHNTNSTKYDFAVARGKAPDLLPMWVADMDFKAPACILEALQGSVKHGVFGYTDHDDAYKEVVIKWFSDRFGYAPSREELIATPGVVFALATAVKAYTKPGEAVLIQQPVYYPFTEVVVDNGRKLINNPLINNNGEYYEIDFDDFEKKIAENDVKMFIFCSPHNPVGRVWTKEELTKISEICLKYKVIVVSDEIHCDFVYEGHKHTMMPSISEEMAQNTVLCTSSSKTFNLAGLQNSNIFIANERLRELFKKEVDKAGYSQINKMGLVACLAGYEYGAGWLEELLGYLWENCGVVSASLSTISGVKLIRPQGTYLGWIDFTGTGLAHEEIDRRILQDAKVWLDEGTMFGQEGRGFMRINVACPRSVVEDAMERIVRVFA